MTDPIADLLTRIRNALAVRQARVVVPSSRLKREIAEILSREGWIGPVSSITVESRPMLSLTLKYRPDGRAVLRSLKRVSRPGRRVYVGRREIPTVLQNIGLAILSTPKGLLTNTEARRARVGGEVLCEVA